MLAWFNWVGWLGSVGPGTDGVHIALFIEPYHSEPCYWASVNGVLVEGAYKLLLLHAALGVHNTLIEQSPNYRNRAFNSHVKVGTSSKSVCVKRYICV